MVGFDKMEVIQFFCLVLLNFTFLSSEFQKKVPKCMFSDEFCDKFATKFGDKSCNSPYLVTNLMMNFVKDEI